ncbi:MAG TPA: hypothetical protein PLL14_02705, partial [Accumulibacter sp.]|nr:hypothetical protein [Accumulibacter sp.]
LASGLPVLHCFFVYPDEVKRGLLPAFARFELLGQSIAPGVNLIEPCPLFFPTQCRAGADPL